MTRKKAATSSKPQAGIMAAGDPIDNPILRSFVDESCRTAADRLAGILEFPGSIVAAAVGKGLMDVLGTDQAKLTQVAEWTEADYADVATRVMGPIVGTDSGGRTLITNMDVIALLRVIVVLNNMINTNPQLKPLIYKFAVNPRA